MKRSIKRYAKRDKRKNGSRKRGGSAYWIATIGTMGALTLVPPSYDKNFNLIYAQEVVAKNSLFKDDTVYQFNIPSGPLGAVIKNFQDITGWQVEYGTHGILDIGSEGIVGSYRAEQAMQKILSNTKVSYRIISPKKVILEISGLTESTEVVDRAVSLSSPKYTEPIRNIPQTIDVIPRQVIEEQGATSLRDVLRNISGLTMAAGEGGVPAGDNLTLRGFSARNDIFIDGVRDIGPLSRDPFNLEQVEVVKGPGSAFTGRGSTGGAINLVSKVPTLNPSFGGSLTFGTDETKRVTADINLPLAKVGLGERTALRLNLMGHENGVAGRDVVENERWGVAPSLAMGLGTPTRLTFSYFHLQQRNMPDYGIPWVTNNHNVLAEFRDKPAPVPRNSFYGLKSRDFEKVDADLGTFKFERDFGDNVTLYNQFRYGRSSRNSITTAPRFASPNSLVINRNAPSWITDDEILDNQTDFKAKFSTGKVEHSLVAGTAFTQENNKRRTRTVTGTLQTTLYNPDPNQPFNGTITENPIVGDVTGNTISLYAFDTLHFGEKWSLIGGLRWDRFAVDGTNTSGLEVERVDRMLSWRTAIVYKPKSNGSVYVAYGSSLNPSLEGLSYQTVSTAIDPEKTYTFEIGSKWDLFKDRLLLSGAVFRVNKTNARTPGLLPYEPPQVLEGEQLVNGLELGITGSITSAWKIYSAYTFLDSEIVESNIPAEVGREIINTPRNSLSLWTTYQSPWKLNLGGGLRFVDSRYGNNTNTRQVDSYYLIDAMASYPVTRHIDLRLNLYNLNNAYYFDRLGGGHLIPGAGRSVSLSTGFRF